MRTEMTMTFPVPLKKGFDYLHEFKTWPMWRFGLIEILEPMPTDWSQPGDEVRFAYKLLGRRLEGVAELEDFHELDVVKFTARVEGLPDIREEWHYLEVSENAFLLKVVMMADETTKFFGRIVDRLLLPKALEKDLRRTMDNLMDIFAMGVPE